MGGTAERGTAGVLLGASAGGPLLRGALLRGVLLRGLLLKECSRGRCCGKDIKARGEAQTGAHTRGGGI